LKKVKGIITLILINITIVATIHGQQLPTDGAELYEYILENYKNEGSSRLISGLNEPYLESLGFKGYTKLYAMYLIASANRKDKDFLKARVLLDSIVDQKDGIDSETFMMDVMSLTADVYRELGEDEKALKLSYELLNLLSKDAYAFKSKVFYNISNIHKDWWRLDMAKSSLDESLLYAEKAVDALRIQRALRGLADYWLLKNNPDMAERYLLRHGPPLKKASEGEITYSQLHARLLEERQQFKEAEAMYMASLEQARLLNFDLIEYELVNDINRNKIKRKKFYREVFGLAAFLMFFGFLLFFFDKKYKFLKGGGFENRMNSLESELQGL
jgi:tetratricopeptide (TPR) repeat protein